MPTIWDQEKQIVRLRQNFVEMKRELDNLRFTHSNDAQMLETLRQSLEAARTDNSRLHQESELVVANVNQWIKEQNLAYDKMQPEEMRESLAGFFHG